MDPYTTTKAKPLSDSRHYGFSRQKIEKCNSENLISYVHNYQHLSITIMYTYVHMYVCMYVYVHIYDLQRIVPKIVPKWEQLRIQGARWRPLSANLCLCEEGPKFWLASPIVRSVHCTTPPPQAGVGPCQPPATAAACATHLESAANGSARFGGGGGTYHHRQLFRCDGSLTGVKRSAQHVMSSNHYESGIF